MADTSQIAQIAQIAPDWRRLTQSFCSLGADEEQLAELFSVSPDTVAGWMAENPDFAHAVQSGRNLASGSAASTLHRLTVGYSHPVERVVKGANGPVIVRYAKHYPPSWRACKTWLENRRPQDWGAANVKRKLQQWEDARDAAARRPLFLSDAALATLVLAREEESRALAPRPAVDPVGAGEWQLADDRYGTGMGICRTVVERVAAQGVLGWFGAEPRHEGNNGADGAAEPVGTAQTGRGLPGEYDLGVRRSATSQDACLRTARMALKPLILQPNPTIHLSSSGSQFHCHQSVTGPS